MDEIGATSIQKPDKIVARKGSKLIRTLVTAIGSHIPPFLAFPRDKFYEYFIPRTAPGFTANKSGWRQGADFNLFLQHFYK